MCDFTKNSNFKQINHKNQSFTLFIIHWPKFFCHLVVLILIIREICFEYIQLGVNQVL